MKNLTGAAAGVLFAGGGLLDAAMAAVQAGGAPKRREVHVGGRRVQTVDAHCHCHVPQAWEVIKDYDIGMFLKGQLDGSRGSRLDVNNAEGRLRMMDQEGIDVEAIGINPFWYGAERSVARDLVEVQNQELAKLCAAHPDRFVGLASVALQYPYLAADQLEDGMKKLGLRGCAIGGSVEGLELANPKFHPFWAKAEELEAMVFIHPQEFNDAPRRFEGKGNFAPVVGNPLETTLALSHLIFEGTLDRFPRLKICAAHGGGYLPSYIGRSDRCVHNQSCKGIKKLPSEYIKQLYFDGIIYTPEGLRHLIAETGVNQIVLGSDYPYGMGDPKILDLFLTAPGLSDDDRRAILGGNAAKLLRIGS